MSSSKKFEIRKKKLIRYFNEKKSKRTQDLKSLRGNQYKNQEQSENKKRVRREQRLQEKRRRKLRELQKLRREQQMKKQGSTTP